MKTSIRLAFLFLIFGSCQSGKIFCPDFGKSKVNSSRVNGQQVRYTRSQLQASAREKAQSDYLHKLRTERSEKKTTDPDEWDCPKPGSKMQRMSQQQRKAIEKRYRMDEKKRLQTDSAAHQSNF